MTQQTTPPVDAAWLGQLFTAVHDLAGPMSALALEVATLEELRRLAPDDGAPKAEIDDLLSEMQRNADRSVERFHALRRIVDAARHQRPR